MSVKVANITSEFAVTDRQDQDERAELQRVNEQLKESLARCRFMLSEARSKLAANSNEHEGEAERGDEKSG